MYSICLPSPYLNDNYCVKYVCMYVCMIFVFQVCKYRCSMYGNPVWCIYSMLFLTCSFLCCFLECFLSSSFLCYHCYLLYRGMTTNESYKWGTVNISYWQPTFVCMNVLYVCTYVLYVCKYVLNLTLCTYVVCMVCMTTWTTFSHKPFVCRM